MRTTRQARRAVIGICVALAVALGAEPAVAELDEIVVTARKREENLQDVPMSVTAMAGETLERLGIRSLADLTRYTPGINLDNGFGLNDQRLVIRGLSPSRGRPNSAILVDGIDLTTESVSTAGGSMLLNQRLLDIERIEVVKGPQSALYGRAAFTGAIQYVTRDPADEFEASAGLDVGDYGRRYLNASISGPFGDTFGVRLNGMNWNSDGFYEEGFTGASLGGGRGKGLSLTAKWEPTDRFSARARIAKSEDKYDQQATFYDPVNTILDLPANAKMLANIKDTQVVGLFSGKAADADGRKTFLTADPATGRAYPGGHLNVMNQSLMLDWDVGPGTITSYTGYVKADSGQVFDGDFDVRPNAAGTKDIARGGIEIDFATDTRMISQELRYASALDGPVQFTVGALFWKENVDQFEIGVSALAFPFGPTGADPDYFNQVVGSAIRIPNEVERDTKSRSVYGLIEFELSEQLKLSLEGRYAREEMRVRGAFCDLPEPAKTFLCGNSTPDIALVVDPVGAPDVYTHLLRNYTVDTASDNYFAPRAMLEWHSSDDVMTYFSISKGVKPGGISTVASGTWLDIDPLGNLDNLKFDAEDLIAYELGVKSIWFERTVTLNGAVFYQDYSNKQLPVQRNIGDFVSTVIDNVGDAEVLGLELEAVWEVSDNVRAQLGYTYLDGEYTTLEYATNSANSIARAGNCTLDADIPVDGVHRVCNIQLNGNTLEDIPTHSIIALGGWYPPLSVAGLNGLLEADVEYQSRRYSDEFNDREVKSFSIVNLRTGVQADRWDVLVYVNNVFDDDTVQSWSTGIGLVATAERTNPDLFAFPGEGFSIAPTPRHWGVRANLRF